MINKMWKTCQYLLWFHTHARAHAHTHAYMRTHAPLQLSASTGGVWVEVLMFSIASIDHLCHGNRGAASRFATHHSLVPASRLLLPPTTVEASPLFNLSHISLFLLFLYMFGCPLHSLFYLYLAVLVYSLYLFFFPRQQEITWWVAVSLVFVSWNVQGVYKYEWCVTWRYLGRRWGEPRRASNRLLITAKQFYVHSWLPALKVFNHWSFIFRKLMSSGRHMQLWSTQLSWLSATHSYL